MKHIEEYLKDVIKVEPLGELTTMDDNLYGMSGEMVYIDGKCSGIFISHADYVNWIEKQRKEGYALSSSNKEDVLKLTERIEKLARDYDINLPNRSYDIHAFAKDLLCWLEKQGEQKKPNKNIEEINNKGFVDLGLPSGTLWAKCNLGAEKATDLGLLFQWGDTKGYESVSEHQFSWEDYKFGSWDDLTKYNGNDTKLILDNEDDPVFVATKGKFKSPTKEQLQELIDCTNHEWTTIDGVNGMKFWKKGMEEPTDGNSYIFIPAAGHCCNDYHYGVDFWGYIWSASRKVFDEGFAWTMKFSDRGGIDICSNCYCNGFSVRGVVAPQTETFDEIDDTDDGQPVDLGLPSGTKWMKSNIGATKPSGFGKFFQWGDTQGYSNIDEHEFNWGDYKWGTFDSIIKYNKNDHLTLLVSNDDSAFVATSGSASMPTKDQLQELIDNTEHRWLRLANGINGMKFWKKGTEEPTESNSYIFIPAVGDCCNGNHSDVGSWGYIWSASRYEYSASYAWCMLFNAGDVDMNYFYRCDGFSVRGVLNK